MRAKAIKSDASIVGWNSYATSAEFASLKVISFNVDSGVCIWFGSISFNSVSWNVLLKHLEKPFF